MDNKGQLLLWRNIHIPDFDVLFLNAYYDSEKESVLLMGLGTNVKPFDYNKYNHFVSCWVDDEGKIYGVKTTILDSQMGYRSIRYPEEKDNLKIVISSDFAFIDLNNNVSFFETVFMEIDREAEVRKYTYLPSTEPNCQCLLPSFHSEGYHCPGVVGYNLDNELNIINREIDRITDIFLNADWIPPLLLWINKNCYVWGGDKYLISNTVSSPYNNKLKRGRTAVFTYSTKDYKLSNHEGIGVGLISFISQTMDITADSMIYTGNFEPKVVVAKLNKELEKIWELKFVFEDKKHNVVGIKALSTGGAVIYGYKYPSGLNDMGNPFVVKFDADGGVSNTAEFPVTTIKTYPNPGIGPLQIEIQGMNGDGTLRLFNSQGRNVYVQTGMQNGPNMIDLSDLPAGSYHYTLNHENRVLHSGSWVKM
ncbi:MAG: T9SS type A sorting domain-containing protein [Saprospiraceae bacterium]|nr:T9SS type A sorting domain-containing protein [Saprospiraceae bacterium]